MYYYNNTELFFRLGGVSVDKKTRNILLYITFGVVLFAALMNFSAVVDFVGKLNALALPVLAGLILAFVLNVPIRGFEKMLSGIFKKFKRPPSPKTITVISLILTIISIVLVFVLALTLAVPEIISSVKSIIFIVESRIPLWIDMLSELKIDTSQFTEWSKFLGWLEQLDIEQLFGKVTSGAGSVLNSVILAATSTVSAVLNGLFAVIIAFYALSSKHDLTRQSKKFIYGHFTETTADKITYVVNLVNETFTKFLSGQCIEAIILGVLILVFFSIFRLPYAALIAFLTSVFALVPYIGAFAAGAIGTFLILIVDPFKALICLAVYLGVQFIETQFIYPHVVGTSVGLSPLLTLVGALIGAKILGLVGIIFFIPLTAVFYTLVREWTNKKIAEKNKRQK